jgi:hypothetical protein
MCPAPHLPPPAQNPFVGHARTSLEFGPVRQKPLPRTKCCGVQSSDTLQRETAVGSSLHVLIARPVPGTKKNLSLHEQSVPASSGIEFGTLSAQLIMHEPLSLTAPSGEK